MSGPSVASSRATLRTRAPLLALLVALVFVVAELLGFVHQAATQHAVCPEHGELVHAEQLATPGAEGPSAPGDAAYTTVAKAPRPRGDADVDEHCRLCAASGPSVTVGVAAADGAGEVGPVAIHFAVPPPADVVAWPRFRTAPKTSPPLA